MAIEIDFTFMIDGSFDSVNYYRSETPMNPESMPVATATGITGTTYTDTTAEKGKTYYVRFGSVKSDIEKISNEIIVSTFNPYLINIIINSSNELVNIGSMSTTWTMSGVNLSHINNEIENTSTTSYLKTNENFNWNGAWEIEFDVFINSSVTTTYYTIVANRHNEWSNGGIFIHFGGNSSASYEENRFGIGNYGSTGIMSNIFPKDTWHHVICKKTSDHKYTMIVNNVMQYENQSPPNPSNIPNDAIINIGMVLTVASSNGVKVRNFKAKDLTVI